MNIVIVMGRLVRDPSVSATGNTTFARFTVAVDRQFKREGEPTADFFNCTSFGKLAEFCEKYLMKGTKVVVTGRLQNDSYTNKEGQKVNETKIIVSNIEFAESKGDSKPEPKKDGFLNIPDNLPELELPFS